MESRGWEWPSRIATIGEGTHGSTLGRCQPVRREFRDPLPVGLIDVIGSDPGAGDRSCPGGGRFARPPAPSTKSLVGVMSVTYTCHTSARASVPTSASTGATDVPRRDDPVAGLVDRHHEAVGPITGKDK
jgi:hypothetical protein